MLRSRRLLDLTSVTGAMLCSVFVAVTAFAEEVKTVPLDGASSLYVKRASLQETMLATRTACADAMPGQAEAHSAVKLGPWYLAGDSANCEDCSRPGEAR